MTAENLINFNRVYGKFYDRRTGNKIYRSNLGGKYSAVAFKRARDAIAYKSKVFMRYTNLDMAHKVWLAEQNKPVIQARWIDRIIAWIKSIFHKLD